MQADRPGNPRAEEGDSPRNFRTETAVDHAILVHIFAAAIAGATAYVAAIMTTTVESGGFWRDLWLGICIATFIYSFCSVIIAIAHFKFSGDGSGQGR
jgi:hypothetical protein